MRNNNRHSNSDHRHYYYYYYYRHKILFVIPFNNFCCRNTTMFRSLHFKYYVEAINPIHAKIENSIHLKLAIVNCDEWRVTGYYVDFISFTILEFSLAFCNANWKLQKKPKRWSKATIPDWWINFMHSLFEIESKLVTTVAMWMRIDCNNGTKIKIKNENEMRYSCAMNIFYDSMIRRTGK